MDENKAALDGVSREELLEVARKLKPLQKKFDTLVEKFKETSKEGNVRKKELEVLQEHMKQSDQQLEDQKRGIEALRAEHNAKMLALQAQLLDQQKQHEAQLAVLRQNVQEPESAGSQAKETLADQQALATENKKELAENEIVELRAKNSALLDSVRDAHDNKTLAQDREQEARRNLEKAKKEAKTLEERLKQTQASTQKEKMDLGSRVVELQQRLEIELTGFETHKGNLNLMLRQAEQGRMTALELVEQLKAACVEKDSKYAASGQEISEMKGKLAQVEKRQAKVLAMEQELVELRTKCEAVQASLEQERVDRAKERVRCQQDLEIEREERVRERGSQEQAREKMAHLRYEETEKAHAKLREAHAHARKADETIAVLTSTIQELNATIERKSRELQEAVGEGGAAKQREAQLAKEHQDAMHTHETKHNDKYQRLLREFKAYRERTTKILDEQGIKLQQNGDLIAKLQEEIATGKPGERRMFELAELQARRDVHIQQQEADLAQLRLVLESHDAAVQKLEEDKTLLSEQCKQLQASRSRGEVNLDYLKNVLLRFFCAAEGSAERKMLIPAICKILQFSSEETACLSQPGTATWWNLFTPAPTKGSLWMGQDLPATPPTPPPS